jgi:hypothetical protein
LQADDKQPKKELSSLAKDYPFAFIRAWDIRIGGGYQLVRDSERSLALRALVKGQRVNKEAVAETGVTLEQLQELVEMMKKARFGVLFRLFLRLQLTKVRVVLLLVAGVHSQGEGLEAFVRAHRRLTEEGQQIYSEHVTVRAGSASIRRLPATVRSLLLGDLATTLWWATPEAPPLHGTLFDELADLTDQVIYDSVAWTDPLRQLIVMANWIERGHAKSIADLAWQRPRLWHRLLSHHLRPLLKRNEHLAGLRTLVFADDPILGHEVDEPGCPAVADAQGALQ